MYLFRTYYIFDVNEMVLIPELLAFSWKKKKKLKRKNIRKLENIESSQIFWDIEISFRFLYIKYTHIFL